MRKLVRKLLAFSSDRGSGIVEMLVVSVLVGSVGMVVIAMPLYFTGSSVRSDQYMKRSNTIESMFGFGTAMLTGTNSNSIGMGPRAVEPEMLPSYHDVVLEDQPFAYYGLNEASNATTVVNSSAVNRGGQPPSNLNLAYVGTVTKAQASLLPRYASNPGSGNRSIAVNGAVTNNIGSPSNNQNFNPASSYPAANTFTIEAWASFASISVARTIASFGPNSYSMVVSGNNNSLRLAHGTTVIATFGNVQPGTHHLVITRSGTSATAYVDGNVLATVTVSTDTPIVTSNGRFRIGVAVGASSVSNAFNGGIDEVALYDKALTPTNVTRHYQAGVSDTANGGQGGVVPVSMSGDQILFKRNDVCYRIFHDQDSREVKVASYNTASSSETPQEKDLCHSIRAVRGPNESTPSGVNSSHPLYDPVLDDPSSPAFTLKTVGRNIETPDSGSVFTYLDPEGAVIDVDAEADSSTSNATYDNDIVVDYIDAIEMEATIAGSETDSDLVLEIPSTTFRQRYPLALNCPRV